MDWSQSDIHGAVFSEWVEIPCHKSRPSQTVYFFIFHSGMAGSPLLPVPMW